MIRRVGFTTLRAVLLVLCISSFRLSLPALTLEDLRNDPQLTPQRFAQHFASFKFKFRAQVQSPEMFLATRCGDCDDYATLAADILKTKGYTPHLIAVRTKKVVHVVCYIEETKSYLDFERRDRADCLVASSNSLAEIADRVATTFKSPWTSVSEFTYADGVKRLVTTLVRKASPGAKQDDAKLASARP